MKTIQYRDVKAKLANKRPRFFPPSIGKAGVLKRRLNQHLIFGAVTGIHNNGVFGLYNLHRCSPYSVGFVFKTTGKSIWVVRLSLLINF